jgi:hypothetical protein
MFIKMKTNYNPKDPDALYEKMDMKENYPTRFKWLGFLCLACKDCFNPLLPLKTGTVAFYERFIGHIFISTRR